MDDAPGELRIRVGGGDHFFIRLDLYSDCAPSGFCVQMRERKEKRGFGVEGCVNGVNHQSLFGNLVIKS